MIPRVALNYLFIAILLLVAQPGKSLLMGEMTIVGSVAGYDFTGDFDSVFSQGVGEGAGSWTQVDGQGLFTSPDTNFTNPILVWNDVILPYDSDWSLNLDISVPYHYDGQMFNSVSENAFVLASLGVFFPTEAGAFTLSSGLEVLSTGEDGAFRRVLGENIMADGTVFTYFEGTELEMIVSQLLFDSELKLLSFGYEDDGFHQSLFALDLEDPEEGWGMTDDDFFHIFIEGRSNMTEVSEFPLSVDNLMADGALVIPEPQLVGMLFGLAALGWVVYSRRRRG